MIYDIGVVLFLLLLTVRGAAKGMAWQLATIASLVLCFLFATPFSLALAPIIKVDPPLNRWIAMLIIYIGFSLVCFGAARAFRSWLEAAKFVEFDRHLGAIFGLLKGALIVFLLTFFLVGMSAQTQAYILTTKTGYVSAVVMQQLHPVMPAEVANIIRPYLKNLPLPEQGPLHDDDHGFADDRRNDTRAVGSPRNKYRPVNEPRKSDRRYGSDDLPSRDAQGRPRPQSEIPDPVTEIVDQVSGYVQKKLADSVNQAIHDNLPNLNGEPELPQPDAADPRELETSADSVPLPRHTYPGRSPNREPVRDRESVPETDRVVSDSRPLGSPLPNRQPQPGNRRALITQIAELFSTSAETQAALITEVEQSLEGVPPAAAAGALQDWYADLMGRSPDPDDGTDVTARLDQRIERQLSRARIPLTELPAGIRGRFQRR